ncbi:MAG: hypothetical protein WKG00_08995 [Polyangiaceae bacterium]
MTHSSPARATLLPAAPASRRPSRAGRILRLASALLPLAGMVLLASSCNLVKPKDKKKFGEACESPFDCESTKCNRERGNMCTKACKADADCGGEYVCAGDPTGTGGSCSVKKGNPTGTPCRDRDECDHGSCLKTGDEPTGFCSQRCVSGNDCPAGYKVCEKISDMGAQEVCLPGDAPTAAPAAKPGAAPKPAAPKPPAKK